MGSFLSLDIGNIGVSVASGSKHGNDVRLETTARFDIPAGCIVDGSVTDKGLFRSALEAGLRQYKFKQKNVIVTINTATAITRKLELPRASAGEMGSMVAFEMKQHVPAGKDYVIDYIQLDSMESNSGNLQTVKAIAIPRQACDVYYEVLAEIKLKPRVLNVQQQVMARLFSKGNTINGTALSGNPLLLIELSSFQTLIHLMVNNEVDITKAMPLGMVNLERTLVDRLQLSPEAAFSKLRSIQSLSDESPEVVDAIKRFFSQMFQELRKMTQYLKTKTNTELLEMVYLYGSEANKPWIERLFAENLDHSVSLVKRHSRISYESKDANAALSTSLVAAGALLQGG